MEKIDMDWKTTKLKSLAKLIKPFNRDWAPLNSEKSYDCSFTLHLQMGVCILSRLKEQHKKGGFFFIMFSLSCILNSEKSNDCSFTLHLQMGICILSRLKEQRKKAIWSEIINNRDLWRSWLAEQLSADPERWGK